jgi:hypothetical protein
LRRAGGVVTERQSHTWSEAIEVDRPENPDLMRSWHGRVGHGSGSARPDLRDGACEICERQHTVEGGFRKTIDDRMPVGEALAVSVQPALDPDARSGIIVFMVLVATRKIDANKAPAVPACWAR